MLFGHTQKGMVTAGFPWFGLPGSLGGAEQTVYCWITLTLRNGGLIGLQPDSAGWLDNHDCSNLLFPRMSGNAVYCQQTTDHYLLFSFMDQQLLYMSCRPKRTVNGNFAIMKSSFYESWISVSYLNSRAPKSETYEMWLVTKITHFACMVSPHARQHG